MEQNFKQQENHIQSGDSPIELRNNNKKKIILTYLLLFCIIVILSGIYFLLINNKKKNDNQGGIESSQSYSEILVKGLLGKSIIPTDSEINEQMTVVKLENYPGDILVGDKQLRFSSDFKHVAYISENGQNTDIYLDGVLIPIENNNNYPYRVNYNFSFSPDSKHFAFTVIWKTGENTSIYGEPDNLEYAIYVDGVPSKIYKYVTNFAFSPDSERYLYRASDKDGHRLVIDGEEQSKYSWIDDKIFFSPDSKRVAYMINSDSFVIDGLKQNYKVDEYTGPFAFSFDSKHYAYISNGQIIFDGKPSGNVMGDNLTISGLQIAPDNKTLSYRTTRNSPGRYVIVGNKEFGPYESVFPDSFNDVTYSSDGSHYAFIAMPIVENPVYGVELKDAIIILKDGNVLGRYDSVSELKFDADNNLSYTLADCRLSGGDFSRKTMITPAKDVVCITQYGGTASGSFVNTIRWNGMRIVNEKNIEITDMFLNPSGKNLIYIEKDTISGKYCAISNGNKTDYYSKLYGPISWENNQVFFWVDQKEGIRLISLDNYGNIGWKIYNDGGFQMPYASNVELMAVPNQRSISCRTGNVASSSDFSKACPENINVVFSGNGKAEKRDGLMHLNGNNYCAYTGEDTTNTYKSFFLMEENTGDMNYKICRAIDFSYSNKISQNLINEAIEKIQFNK